jgi:hypothetical protein
VVSPVLPEKSAGLLATATKACSAPTICATGPPKATRVSLIAGTKREVDTGLNQRVHRVRVEQVPADRDHQMPPVAADMNT